MCLNLPPVRCVEGRDWPGPILSIRASLEVAIYAPVSMPRSINRVEQDMASKISSKKLTSKEIDGGRGYSKTAWSRVPTKRYFRNG